MCTSFQRFLAAACAAAVVFTSFGAPPVRADEPTEEAVINAIERGKRFLAGEQNRDGSWLAAPTGGHRIGTTSLVLLALLNSGMTHNDEPVRKGLEYLRREQDPSKTYEVSLMISALAVAGQDRDKARILKLAQKLERGQHTRGDGQGAWGYDADRAGVLYDRSNAQFAILGLYEAAHAGIPVSREVWERARKHWTDQQSADGGWNYSGPNHQTSTGSMTVAGIATLVITEAMLAEGKDQNPDGTPHCCPERKENESLERALRWLGNEFAVDRNPPSLNRRRNNLWQYYYLYGLERAGRLSGRRFFGEHDWYRAGADWLVRNQDRRTGKWEGGTMEGPVIATSFSLLFLSKGLAPVLINKLDYSRGGDIAEAAADDNWNKHTRDIHNLTDLISGLSGWPKLVTWQSVEMRKLAPENAVRILMQSPVLYISGKDAPNFTDEQVAMLRDYVDQGGFIFAVRNCDGEGFDRGIRETVARMFPMDGIDLKRLPADHPVYRAEHLLDPEAVELLGVDLGCRTPVIYSPADVSCLWDKWARYDPPRRTAEMKSMITRATQVGVNVIAYATGREPPTRLGTPQVVEDEREDRIERGFLQIAKLRHTGRWDVAPRAVRNLLVALNETAGLAASTKTRDLAATDRNIFKYPIVYMHGQNTFQLSRQEREQLKTYLERGGFLFADAACGSKQFDQSFRSLMQQLFPDREFERIPVDHEMFSSEIGYDIRRVKRRAPEADDPKAALNPTAREAEPFLEGIEIDGRYAVVYSKFDISCVLERQASVACVGYVPEDAVKIAVNVILYALLQDVSYIEEAGKQAGHSVK
jgi:hypothetical protein